MPQSSPAEPDKRDGVWAFTCKALRVIGKPLEWLFIGMVKLYQRFLSPLLPRTCRFYPSCSQYMVDALRLKGPLIGLYMGIWRIMRCNPLCEGGYDPVVPPDESTDKPDNGIGEHDKS